MSELGNRLIDSMEEALAIAKGEQPAARITVKGHTYIPEAELAKFKGYLEQALGQWNMYAELQEDRDLLTEKSAEADLFRSFRMALQR